MATSLVDNIVFYDTMIPTCIESIYIKFLNLSIKFKVWPKIPWAQLIPHFIKPLILNFHLQQPISSQQCWVFIEGFMPLPGAAEKKAGKRLTLPMAAFLQILNSLFYQNFCSWSLKIRYTVNSLPFYRVRTKLTEIVKTKRWWNVYLLLSVLS